MSESKITTEMVNELITTLKEGKAFVAEQAPDIFNEILTYDLTMSWVWFGVFMFLCACFIVGLVGLLIKYQEDDPIIYMIPFVGIPFCFIISCIHANNIIQINMAPKLYLLEYLRGLL